MANGNNGALRVCPTVHSRRDLQRQMQRLVDPNGPIGAAATTAERGTVKQAAAVPNSTATTVAGLVADFNTLLSHLRAAGILKT